jgi:hypothetical protein
MRRFAYRAVREALSGVAAGALGAIIIRFALGLSVKALPSLESNSMVGTAISITKDPDTKFLGLVTASCLLLLFASPIGSFLLKLLRSWSVGLITGIFPVWFILALLFFVPRSDQSVERCLMLAAVGTVFVILACAIVVARQRGFEHAPVIIPEPSRTETTVEPGIKFDLPIQVWSDDRLKRGTLIRTMAGQILRDKPPVLAVVGPFGEGKTSALNLLAASLVNRSDIILVRFSSWLPGDSQTLAISLFATISKQIKSRYLVFGLSDSLRKFARLLAGTIPRFGDNLRQILEPPSQMEQLDNLKKLLGELSSRVVVLVDEMDRLDRAELFVVLKAIRGVADLPNMTYVCAFDKKAVARLISQKDLAYGEYYLEKFFPMRVVLPAVDQLLLGAVFDSELESICATYGLLQDENDKKTFSEEILPLWNSSIKHTLTNFRKLALFFNALRTALAPVYSEVNLFDMVVLQLVRLISEDTYNFIWANGPVFYYPSWRVDLWPERLSVDDNIESKIRKHRLDTYFTTLPTPLRNQITELLRKIFPTVNESLEDRRHSRRSEGEEVAQQNKRIYHPDYFARYFIHQVQGNLFGKREMTVFLEELNADDNLQIVAAKFRSLIDSLPDYWRRLSFLDSLVDDCRRLGDVQAEAVAIAVSRISDLLQPDVMGLGDWGKARAIVFVAASRFSGTPKLQELLVDAIREAASDGFAADILRFSTKMKDKNNVITNWRHVDEQAIMQAFARRMAARYTVGSGQQPPYSQRESISSFLIWVGINDEARGKELEFFRDRFQRDPAEVSKFIGWLLPRHGLLYDGDPLVTLEKLFPLDELFGLIGKSQKESISETERESVQWFVELVGKRKTGPTPGHDPLS